MNSDELWFALHNGRQCHIRVAHPGESEKEFRALGPHHVSRRRVLLWKIPADAPIGAGKIADVPFLASADETIEDDDKVLLPILAEFMGNARAADEKAHPELYRRQ